MPSYATVIVIVAIYVALLVFAGWRADRRPDRRLGTALRPALYSLSLATLCSAWTYFGAVGDAANGSWLFVANALGPALAVTLGYPMWRKIAVLAKQENVGSLADFLAARYGKSRALGIICTCVATVGALPYIALQLDVLTRAWAFATGGTVHRASSSLLLIAFLAAVAIAFGARRPSLTQQSRGFVSMLALEAMVKLFALLCVAILAIVLLARLPNGLAVAIHAVPPIWPSLDGSFFVLTILCTVTAFTLPRQFHLGFVALEEVSDVRTARWLVPAYFFLWAVVSAMIAIAIRAGLGDHAVPSQLQVLALPMERGGSFVAVLALLGGLSAGAGMVVVETTAISAMISNDLILPLFANALRPRLSAFDASRWILLARRATIVMVALLAWVYYLLVSKLVTPTQLGQTALTAFAQFLPPLVGGLYWRRGHASGAIAGIIAGITVWTLAIAAPALLLSAVGRNVYGDAVWPTADGGWVNAAAIISLIANASLYVLVSLGSRPRLIDTLQARNFVGEESSPALHGGQPIRATIGDIRSLLQRFMGREEAEMALYDIRTSTGERLTDDSAVTPTHARMAEKLLAGVIGAPSARNVVAIAVLLDGESTTDVDRILDDAAHAVHFNRELLQTTLESLSQGVCVIDDDLRLVAWNRSYIRLLEQPLAQIYIGKPLAELISGGRPSVAAQEVRSRINALRDDIARAEEVHDEWQLSDGRTLQIFGRPLAQGDYLTTISDMTEVKEAERVLSQDKEMLEGRVRERTAELSAANAALADANAVAERASGAQKRFVATASHDLVQPLHAARLFIGNALPAVEGDPALYDMLQRADHAIDAAHGLMRALLNLSRLEVGALEPDLQPVDAGALLQSLAQEFTPQANARGLTLAIDGTQCWVSSDRDLLRSMLQNLLLNAIRYTAKGDVAVDIRLAGDDLVRFEISDTGVGIPTEKIDAIFGEFSRLPEGRSMAEGAGLGLAIVARIGQVLGHPIAVTSEPGRGSIFAITVPRAKPALAARPKRVGQPDLGGLRVLCIDDERDVLIGTKALIERWGGTVDAVDSVEEASELAGGWDVVIADHHLPGENGLSFLRRLNEDAKARLLVTATPEEGSEAGLLAEGIQVLRKPAPPLVLRDVLLQVADGIRSRVSATS